MSSYSYKCFVCTQDTSRFTEVFIKAFTAFIKGFTACKEIEEWDLPCLRSYRSGSYNSGAVSSSTHHSNNTQGGTEAEHERPSDRRLHCSTQFPKRRGKTDALQEITANGTNTVNDKSPVYCGWPQTRDARSLSHAFLCICCGCWCSSLCSALQCSVGLLILQASSAWEFFL